METTVKKSLTNPDRMTHRYTIRISPLPTHYTHPKHGSMRAQLECAMDRDAKKICCKLAKAVVERLRKKRYRGLKVTCGDSCAWRSSARDLCNSREWVSQGDSAIVRLKGRTFLPLPQSPAPLALDRRRSLPHRLHFSRRPRHAVREKRAAV